MRPSLTRRNILVGRIPRGDREHLFHVIGKATIAQVEVGDTAHTEFVICEQSIDVNHGYGKTLVPNSEISKKRAALEKRLSDIQRWAPAAREQSSKASLRYTRLRKETKAKGEERYRTLDEQLQQLQAQSVPPGQWKTERNKLQAEAERDMQALWERVSRVLETSNKEFARWEHYCREQGELLRALEDLAVQERTMYELDNRKDQIMTVCKVALANLGMYVVGFSVSANPTRIST